MVVWEHPLDVQMQTQSLQAGPGPAPLRAGRVKPLLLGAAACRTRRGCACACVVGRAVQARHGMVGSTLGWGQGNGTVWSTPWSTPGRVSYESVCLPMLCAPMQEQPHSHTAPCARYASWESSPTACPAVRHARRRRVLLPPNSSPPPPARHATPCRPPLPRRAGLAGTAAHGVLSGGQRARLVRVVRAGAAAQHTRQPQDHGQDVVCGGGQQRARPALLRCVPGPTRPPWLGHRWGRGMLAWGMGGQATGGVH